MIGKPITGKSFGGCVRYFVDRKATVMLDVSGVCIQNAKAITQDFKPSKKDKAGTWKSNRQLVLS